MDLSEHSPASAALRWRLRVGLIAPPLAWMGFEYGLGWTMRGDCGAVAWVGPAWGLTSLVVCAAAWLIARPPARDGAGANPPVRPWLARVALLGPAVFGLAIAMQTLATTIVPPCAR